MCKHNATVQRSPPTGNPATTSAAGIDDECEIAFCEGCDAGVHLFDVTGGGPCCAADYCVVCAHSLPQETSAERNVITLFSTVNNPAKLFFSGGQSSIATHAHQCHANVHQRMLHATAHRHAIALHASTDAAGSGTCIQPCTSTRMTCRSSILEECMRDACPGQVETTAKQTCVCASHKSVCAKTARTFPAINTHVAFDFACTRHRKKKTRDVAAAG